MRIAQRPRKRLLDDLDRYIRIPTGRQQRAVQRRRVPIIENAERLRVTAAPATGSFLGGYLTVWGLFSLAAAVLQMLLGRAGIMAGMDMVSVSRPFSAALLIAAGIYQLSPFKDVCLSHCRNPAKFLTRHYRPGRAGAWRMGMIHGAFCAGCCWLLMALLFVIGVMNMLWVAAITVLVLLERLLPAKWRAASIAGMIFCAWGAVVIAMAW